MRTVTVPESPSISAQLVLPVQSFASSKGTYFSSEFSEPRQAGVSLSSSRLQSVARVYVQGDVLLLVHWRGSSEKTQLRPAAAHVALAAGWYEQTGVRIVPGVDPVAGN